MSGRTALVTGGSSGIGLAAALALRDAGCAVWELSRREQGQQGLRHVSCDVTDEAALAAAANQAAADGGTIDILVCCAGFGISGAIEFTDAAAAKKQLDVNFFGVVNSVRAVLPHMRRAGRGRIVITSSVAAPVPIPFQAYYAASKAAINSYACALANELRPYGITVCAVMPGDIATGFTAARQKITAGDDVYGGRIARSVAVMEHDERTGMSPQSAGEYIARLALRARVKPLYAIGVKYKFFTVLMRLLPCRLSNWILYEIYAK